VQCTRTVLSQKVFLALEVQQRFLHKKLTD
jgi:hypothetical protein